MKLPSKELLSEVLQVNVLFFAEEISGEYDPCLSVHYRPLEPKHEDDGGILLLNIYELAHRCKEWALRKGYIVASGLNEEGRWWCDVSEVKIFPAINGTYVQDTEMEAVTKACEWIMEQTK